MNMVKKLFSFVICLSSSLLFSAAVEQATQLSHEELKQQITRQIESELPTHSLQEQLSSAKTKLEQYKPLTTGRFAKQITDNPNAHKMTRSSTANIRRLGLKIDVLTAMIAQPSASAKP